MKTKYFNNKRIVITGGAGAIGQALAKNLHSHGARIELWDREPIAPAPYCESTRIVDLLDPNLATNFHQSAEDEIFGWINCAGFMHVQQLVDIDWEILGRLIDVDLRANLQLMQLAAQHRAMQSVNSSDIDKAANGFIVNIASIAGVGALKGCTGYGAAKAGLAMASEIAREELSPKGIRIVTVYPGPVQSQLEQGARDQYERSIFRDRLPVGKPDALARHIVKAVAKNEPRVVYPKFYTLSERFSRQLSAFTLKRGPWPQ